jgi:hypothetical protein
MFTVDEMLRMRRVLLASLAGLVFLGCHRGGGEPPPPPGSCLIEHDGGVTQCFDEIGAAAKKFGDKTCGEMYGEHTYRPSKPCPAEGVVGSCRKGAGTDLERVERCYRDGPACERRCARSGGAFSGSAPSRAGSPR